MTHKADFTTDEWITLRAALDATLYNTAIADRKVYDVEATTGRRLVMAAMPLVQGLLQRGVDTAEDALVVDRATEMPLTELFDHALGILKARASREEIVDLSKTLRALAQAVAEADGEVALGEVEFLDRLDALLRAWQQ